MEERVKHEQLKRDAARVKRLANELYLAIERSAPTTRVANQARDIELAVWSLRLAYQRWEV